MVAIAQSTTPRQGMTTSDESRLAHWQQLRRFSTLEDAEEMIADLQSQGLDARLSMIDGLCVLARREV